MTNPRARTIARTGAIAALVLASGLLTAPPASAQPTAVSAPQRVVTITDTAGAESAAARPSNGRILYSGIRGGLGRLTIKNGLSRDGVVTLVRGRTKAISVYVRARKSTTVRNIKDGTYRVFFTTGYRFSVSKGRFTRSATYQRFNSRLLFRTTATQFSTWRLTLHAVPGGNAGTTTINPKDFPA
ncbi:hypothetical protein AB0K60_12490 [Thermopolyspora sp. NPDC052614]|uniref:hypothetical protein n=1 Tax=Thermopolyspora sp. NPDC052614 TaxID=3155682 RepID=UPI003427164C